jgi:predicted alpha/beta hydrolase
MQERSVSIPALDGYRLAGSLFAPPEAESNGVVVQVNGAAGVRRERYRAFARFLCGRGFHVVTYNYRGIGDSNDAGWQGVAPTMQDWGQQDLGGVVEWISREFPKMHIVCVGHATGGQWLGLARNNTRVAAQLAISSASGYWGHFRLRHWPKLLVLWYLVVPLATRLLGYLPGWLTGTEDLPKGVALDWARWSRNRHYITDRQGRPAREHYRRYRGRMRFCVIGDDARFAPPEAVRALAGYYENADRQIFHIAPSDYGVERIGHFGFFDDGAPEQVWAQCADWLREAVAPSLLQQAAITP